MKIKATITLSVLLMLGSCTISKNMIMKSIDKSDITSIDLSAHKISLAESGITKLSSVGVNDTIIILGVKFLVADNNNAYFPLIPIIFKSGETPSVCYFMIDHLNKKEYDRIIKALKQKG